jgi:hypothetical protein
MSPGSGPDGELPGAQREGSLCRSLDDIERELAAAAPRDDAPAAAAALLAAAEEVLERWIEARGETPTGDTREGFRLLALHRQGARGTPSFNACRETCREIAYYFNLLRRKPGDPDNAQRQRMMAMLVRHLALFVAGKLQVEGLGEFCCASRPLHAAT